ncbi:MAG: hypothetical protein AAF081_08945 [Actinomycetota bacterium]
MSNPLAEHPTDPPIDQPPLHVLRWHDPLIDQLGHDPRSRYVERFWLGILGPSTTLLLRVWADALDEHGGSAHLDLGDVAAQIGVGHRGGRNSPLARSMQRAIRFGAARSAGPDTIEARHRLAPLNRSQIERLPIGLQAEHQRLYERPPEAGPARSRARRLALSLIECGDGFADTERQLDQWRVPGPVAAEAVNWAWERHRAAAEHGSDAA